MAMKLNGNGVGTTILHLVFMTTMMMELLIRTIKQ